MAKVLDNGDVASQAPVHTAALVTDQHTSADRCPARVWGREEGGQLLPQERYHFPSTHSGLAYTQYFRYFTQSPQEPRSWPLALSYKTCTSGSAWSPGLLSGYSVLSHSYQPHSLSSGIKTVSQLFQREAGASYGISP